MCTLSIKVTSKVKNGSTSIGDIYQSTDNWIIIWRIYSKQEHDFLGCYIIVTEWSCCFGFKSFSINLRIWKKHWKSFSNKYLFILRILTGKKRPTFKLQRLRKIRILTFGSLVHQINFFQEVLKLEQISPQN